MAALHAVPSGDKTSGRRPRRKPAKSVAEAAERGSQLELLVAMRDRVATAISNPDCPPRDLGTLTRRLQDIVKEIGTLEAQGQRRGSSSRATTADEGYDPSAI